MEYNRGKKALVTLARLARGDEEAYRLVSLLYDLVLAEHAGAPRHSKRARD